MEDIKLGMFYMKMNPKKYIFITVQNDIKRNSLAIDIAIHSMSDQLDGNTLVINRVL